MVGTLKAEEAARERELHTRVRGVLTSAAGVFLAHGGRVSCMRVVSGSGFRARGTGTGLTDLARQTLNRYKNTRGGGGQPGRTWPPPTPVRPREVASYSQSTGRALCVSRLFPVFLNVPPDLVRPTRYR